MIAAGTDAENIAMGLCNGLTKIQRNVLIAKIGLNRMEVVICDHMTFEASAGGCGHEFWWTCFCAQAT